MLVLHSLLHEQVDSVRRKAVDTICNLTNNSMDRGTPQHTLQVRPFAMCKGADPSPTAHDNMFCTWVSTVLRVLQDGLQGRQCIDVRTFIFLPKSQCSFDFFVGLARGSAGFGILSHVLQSAPSRTVLIAHVPDA